MLAVIFFIAALLSFLFWDSAVALWVADADVNQSKLVRIQHVLDIVSLKFVSAAVGPLFLLLGWLFLRSDRVDLGRFLVGLGGCIAITEYCIDLMKWLFGRLRPDQWVDGGADVSLWFADGTSFPSGHAGYYAALIGALAIRFPRRASLILPIPVFVAIQRILTERHHVSDVLTGIAIAILAVAVMSNWLRPPPTSCKM